MGLYTLCSCCDRGCCHGPCCHEAVLTRQQGRVIHSDSSLNILCHALLVATTLGAEHPACSSTERLSCGMAPCDALPAPYHHAGNTIQVQPLLPPRLRQVCAPTYRCTEAPSGYLHLPQHDDQRPLSQQMIEVQRDDNNNRMTHARRSRPCSWCSADAGPRHSRMQVYISCKVRHTLAWRWDDSGTPSRQVLKTSRRPSELAKKSSRPVATLHGTTCAHNRASLACFVSVRVLSQPGPDRSQLVNPYAVIY